MYTRGFNAALAALVASTVSAKGGMKKSKAGSMQGSNTEIPFSCSNYMGGGSGGKQSKAGGSCGGTAETLRCGSVIEDSTVVLTENLNCDDTDEDSSTIVLVGPTSLLDCQGNTIRGDMDDEDYDPIVLLVDGASVYNCNFMGGYHAVETAGDGCTTIEKVSSYYTKDDAIQVQQNGTVVIKDLYTYGSEEEGLDIGNWGCYEGELQVFLQDIQVIAAHDSGICFDGPGDGNCDDYDIDVTIEMFGEIFVDAPEGEGIEISDGNNVIVHGHVSVFGSGQDEGIDIKPGANVTFVEGSSGVFCYNEEEDIDVEVGFGDLTLEEGVVLVCDTAGGEIDDDDCTASCDDFVTRAAACID